MPPPISLRALRDATRRINEIGALGGAAPAERWQETIQLHVGRITSTTKTEDRYPGTRYDYFANTDNAASPPAGSYVAGETIWIKSRRSETLTVGVNYDLALVGVRLADGIPIYAVVSPPVSSVNIAARMSASATQAITTALQTQVAWDTSDWDNDSLVDLANDRFTITTAGRYLVTCTVAFATNTSGSVRRLRLHASSGTPSIFAGQTSWPVALGDYLSCSGIVQLADTDTVHATVYHDAGVNVNLTTDRVMSIEYLGESI